MKLDKQNQQKKASCHSSIVPVLLLLMHYPTPRMLVVNHCPLSVRKRSYVLSRTCLWTKGVHFPNHCAVHIKENRQEDPAKVEVVEVARQVEHRQVTLVSVFPIFPSLFASMPLEEHLDRYTIHHGKSMSAHIPSLQNSSRRWFTRVHNQFWYISRKELFQRERERSESRTESCTDLGDAFKLTPGGLLKWCPQLFPEFCI